MGGNVDEQGECKKCVYLLIQKIVEPEVKDCIWRHIGQNLTNSGSEKSTDLSLLWLSLFLHIWMGGGWEMG